MGKGIGKTKEVKMYRLATATFSIGLLLLIMLTGLYCFNIIGDLYANTGIAIVAIIVIASCVVVQRIFKIMCPN